jgi:hypothetical protein
MAKGYEKLYEDLRPRLANIDLEVCARRMGLPPTVDGVIRYEFLGRNYLISNSGISITDNRPENINARSVLIHYLLSSGRYEPSGEFVPMSCLTGMVTSGNAHDRFFAKPLVRGLGKNYRGPLKIPSSLAGTLDSCSSGGKHVWHFQPLPKIALRLIHYEADDEFPLDFIFLFDRNAVNILEYECLGFLLGCFTYELQAAIKSGQSRNDNPK